MAQLSSKSVIVTNVYFSDKLGVTFLNGTDRVTGGTFPLSVPGKLAGVDVGDEVAIDAEVRFKVGSKGLYLQAITGQYAIKKVGVK